MNHVSVLLYGIMGAALLIYLPFFPTAYARLTSGFQPSAPRAMFDKLPDYAKRATWAHQNAFESFGLFLAAALMVLVTAKSSQATSTSVLVYLLARSAYSLCYILDQPWLRSLCWATGMACIGSLMLTSIG